MKRNPRKVKWTKAYRKLAGKELAEVRWRPPRTPARLVPARRLEAQPASRAVANCVKSDCASRGGWGCQHSAARRDGSGAALQDATFEMERRRNRPEKYDRELVGKTLAAIKVIDKVRTRRQERHKEARMRAARPAVRAAERKELAAGVHLVRAPEGLVATAAAEEKARASKAEASGKRKSKKLRVSAEGGDLAAEDAALDMSD